MGDIQVVLVVVCCWYVLWCVEGLCWFEVEYDYLIFGVDDCVVGCEVFVYQFEFVCGGEFLVGLEVDFDDFLLVVGCFGCLFGEGLVLGVLYGDIDLFICVFDF